MTTAISWLKARAAEVRSIENKALAALEDGNSQAYREAMRHKAQVLAALPVDAADCLAALPPDKRELVMKRLLRFAGGASNALSLDSVFYMSALLYPEDYREGQPNDLEAFIASIDD